MECCVNYKLILKDYELSFTYYNKLEEFFNDGGTGGREGSRSGVHFESVGAVVVVVVTVAVAVAVGVVAVGWRWIATRERYYFSIFLSCMQDFRLFVGWLSTSTVIPNLYKTAILVGNFFFLLSCLLACFCRIHSIYIQINLTLDLFTRLLLLLISLEIEHI